MQFSGSWELRSGMTGLAMGVTLRDIEKVSINVGGDDWEDDDWDEDVTGMTQRIRTMQKIYRRQLLQKARARQKAFIITIRRKNWN